MRHAGLRARLDRLSAKAKPYRRPNATIAMYEDDAPLSAVTGLLSPQGTTVARKAGEALSALCARVPGLSIAIYPDIEC